MLRRSRRGFANTFATSPWPAELARAQAKYRKQGTRTDLEPHTVRMKLKQGETPAYLLRRLARDHPAILARYERDAVADLEHATELLKGKVGPHGVHMSTPGVLTKGGTDRQAAQLATRRPESSSATRPFIVTRR
jgi:hypothetical protein